MKLRNKETGEIREAETREDGVYLWHTTAGGWFKYGLTKLADEWEEYESPGFYWYVDFNGKIACALRDDNWEREKAIGNVFETREEAEKAVEKLETLQRLKDKGFVFQGWEEGNLGNGIGTIDFYIPEYDLETDVVDDLNLLFEGEE